MTAQLWWIVRKDLICECRARQVWPRMLLLGLVVTYLLSYQLAAFPRQLQQSAASLCWLTICFAAVLTLGQSTATEREEGCWEGLLLYPVAPQTIYFAKLIVSALSLGVLQCVVVPLFALVAHMPWLAHPGELLIVSGLGNLGITSIGTLLGAMSAGMRQSQNLLALWVLPLLIPVILAASEATRLTGDDSGGHEWWRWVQLLIVFDIIYLTAGWALFEFVIED